MCPGWRGTSTVRVRAASELREGAAGSPPRKKKIDAPNEVLIEIGRGRPKREIARTLALSEKTVKAHVSAVLAGSACPTVHGPHARGSGIPFQPPHAA